MEDLSRKISELLADPQTLAQIKDLAGMFQQGGAGASAGAPSSAVSSAAPAVSSAPVVSSAIGSGTGMTDGFPDAAMLGMVKRLAPLLHSFREEDESTRLLQALKPFMHEERAKRIDGAIRLLHMMKLLPLLKGTGLDLFSL